MHDHPPWGSFAIGMALIGVAVVIILRAGPRNPPAIAGAILGYVAARWLPPNAGVVSDRSIVKEDPQDG